MQLGVAIAVYIIIAIVLILLFCFAVRYFNYKLKKSLENPQEIYTMVQGIEGEPEAMQDDEYDDFLLKRIQEQKKQEGQLNKEKKIQFQMTEMKEPLKPADSNIYGVANLRRRIEKPMIILPATPQSIRSFVTPKTFVSDKLDIYQERNHLKLKEQFSESQDSPKRQSTLNSPKRKAKVTKHKFISKIIAYTDEGISIIENKVREFWIEKQNGPIKQKKEVKKTFISQKQSIFKDSLQAYGFEEENFESFRFITTVQIPNMQPFQTYRLAYLKKLEEKQPMNFPSFYYAKDQFQKNETKIEELSDES